MKTIDCEYWCKKCTKKGKEKIVKKSKPGVETVCGKCGKYKKCCIVRLEPFYLEVV